MKTAATDLREALARDARRRKLVHQVDDEIAAHGKRRRQRPLRLGHEEVKDEGERRVLALVPELAQCLVGAGKVADRREQPKRVCEERQRRCILPGGGLG